MRNNESGFLLFGWVGGRFVERRDGEDGWLTQVLLSARVCLSQECTSWLSARVSLSIKSASLVSLL